MMATSSSLALAEDEAAFDVAVGQVWHWTEEMDYYVVSAQTVKGRDIGLHVSNARCRPDRPHNALADRLPGYRLQMAYE